MNGYISKPIQAQELIELVESFTGDGGPIDIESDSASMVVDWESALSRVGGDEELLSDLARLFLEESPRMLSAVQQAVERNSASELQRAAHSMKGSVATFSAQHAFDAALKLERLARASELAGVDEAFAVLAAEVGRLRVALESLSGVPGLVPGVRNKTRS